MPKIKEIIKTLKWLANETEFTFAKEQLTSATDLIESLTARAEQAERELAELRDADRWISCEERLPDSGQVVNIRKTTNPDKARYCPEENWYSPWKLIEWPIPEAEEGTFVRNASAVTEWRPLPQPPQKGE